MLCHFVCEYSFLSFIIEKIALLLCLVNPNPTSTSTSNQASDPKTSEYFQTNTDVKR